MPTSLSAADRLKAESAASESSVPKSAPVATRTEWGLAALGGVLLWASFPPIGFWPMAWVALVPWLWLIRRGFSFARPNRLLFVAGYVTWLALVQWVRLPHPAAYLGWVALCLPLAVYTMAFFWLTHIAVHQWRWPIWLAGPVVWCGIESLRAWLFTGFAMMLFGHTQANVPLLIQISDFGGPHAVSFVLVMFAGFVTWALPTKSHPEKEVRKTRRLLGPLLGIALLALVAGYGAQRIKNNRSVDGSARVALVQGSIDTTFTAADKSEASFAEYLALAQHASLGENGERPDLVVWPETMFGGDLANITADSNYATPDRSHFIEPVSEAEYRGWLESRQDAFKKRMVTVASEFDVPQLIGVLTYHLGTTEQRRYNTALWIDRAGEVQTRYDKIHPVMFGEYVPFGELVPAIYKLTPLSNGLTRGDGPKVVRAGDLNFSPSICFENSVPHLIRKHVHELEDGGTPVHGLITMTNDGWFWGSSLLDVHLACGVFRAVENRRPMLIAANTGFSAYIDQFGDVVKKGPRRDSEVLFANVAHNSSLKSIYSWLGDWLGLSCSGVCVLLVADGWRRRRAATRN